jgi:cell division septum initiation protein DivIVA
VEHVVQIRDTLQNENQDLKNRIEQLETIVQEKVEAEKKHEELNTLVRSKIDSLIGTLEGNSKK